MLFTKGRQSGTTNNDTTNNVTHDKLPVCPSECPTNQNDVSILPPDSESLDAGRSSDQVTSKTKLMVEPTVIRKLLRKTKAPDRLDL